MHNSDSDLMVAGFGLGWRFGCSFFNITVRNNSEDATRRLPSAGYRSAHFLPHHMMSARFDSLINLREHDKTVKEARGGPAADMPV